MTAYVAFQSTTANEVVDEANVATHSAMLVGKLFQQQACNVGPLLTEATLRTDGAKLTAAALGFPFFAFFSLRLLTYSLPRLSPPKIVSGFSTG